MNGRKCASMKFWHAAMERRLNVFWAGVAMVGVLGRLIDSVANAVLNRSSSVFPTSCGEVDPAAVKIHRNAAHCPRSSSNIARSD